MYLSQSTKEKKLLRDDRTGMSERDTNVREKIELEERKLEGNREDNILILGTVQNFLGEKRGC